MSINTNTVTGLTLLQWVSVNVMLLQWILFSVCLSACCNTGPIVCHFPVTTVTWWVLVVTWPWQMIHLSLSVVSKVPPPMQCAVKLEVQLWKYDMYCGLSVEGLAALECSLAVQGVKAEAGFSETYQTLQSLKFESTLYMFIVTHVTGLPMHRVIRPHYRLSTLQLDQLMVCVSLFQFTDCVRPWAN